MRLVVAAVSALAIAQGVVDAQTSRPARQYTIDQFLASESIRGASFSPDERKIAFSSNRTGVFNAYTTPVAGGTATPLTTSGGDSTFVVGYFPRDDRILFTRDQGGNELDHLFVKLPDGQERDLTPGQKLKAAFAGWSRDLQSFFVHTNERDARYFDLYQYDATTYERTRLFQNDVGYLPSAVSGDGRWVALDRPNSQVDSDIFLADTTSGEVKLITPHEGVATFEAQEFDPESKSLYYLTNLDGEFLRVKRYDLARGTHEDVEGADWDITATAFSFNGRFRVSYIAEDGTSVVRVWDTLTGKPVELPKPSSIDVTAVVISRSEKYIAFHASSDRTPTNLYVWTVGARNATKLTDTQNKEIDPADLVDAEVVRFKSFDGLAIPNILYKPHQATAEAKAPALVWVHGGPGGQTRRGYSMLIQYLANHGYVVLGINNRGSSGYGKKFYAADDRRHGREPLWDCVEAKRYLASLPYVDADRVGIIGGSYGGYMVLAALAFRPGVFAAGVDIFGVSNWVRTLQGIPPWWEFQRRSLYLEIGDPTTDLEMLRDASPLFHADKIRKPLLVLQGANDPRVVRAESDDIVAAVKKNGVPVEYVVFADEGHGFTKTRNQSVGYGAVLKFLDRYLKAPASSPG